MRLEDLNPPAIVRPAVNLEEELAQKIKDREKRMVENTLEHARLQGADLLQIKQRLGKRKLKPWLDQNCPFSRETAYRYMMVAEKWESICQRGLQMASFHRVIKTLSGQRKKPAKSPATPEAGTTTDEPGNNREDAKSQTKSGGGEPNDANSESTSGAVQGSDQENAATEPESQPEAHHNGANANHDQKQTDPDKKPPRKERSRPRFNEKDGTNDVKNAAVIGVKHRRIASRLQSLINKLLDFESQDYGIPRNLIPRDLSALVREEDIQVQVLLATLEDCVKGCRNLKKMMDKASRSAGKGKFPEWQM